MIFLKLYLKIKKMIQYKALISVIINKISMWLTKTMLFLQRRFKLTKVYQPDPFNDINYSILRPSSDRFALIDNYLPNSPLSSLDIGCNEGYFTFKMAERGGFCVGVDSARNEIMIAKALSKIHSIHNAVFLNDSLRPKTLLGYAKFDVIIFLSVFHHIVRHNGLDYGLDFMRSLASINTQYLIFETGQPNEDGVGWTDDLAFMEPDVETWVKYMLTSVGYKKVTVIGQNKSVKSDVMRLLFLAEK